MSRQKI